MKLVKNIEVERCLDTIVRNVNEYLTYNKNRYDYRKAKADIVKELSEKYSNLGLDLKVKHSIDTFFDIPYNRDIKFNGIKNNRDISLEEFTINKNVLHMFDYPITDKYLKTYVHYGAYDKDIKTFKVTENGNVYMTPTVMEYNTMKAEIDRAKGNVLTFGLGIGFFQYMCLLKDDVTHVTVIEKNETIINFFKEYILPQFKRKDITIIKGNAFDYFKKDYFEKYDYIFVDIHFNNDDGIEVYKKLIKSDVDMNNVGFWIENQILFENKMLVASYLYNYYKGTITEMLSLDSPLKRKFRCINRLFKNEMVNIDNEEMVLKYINDKEFLRKIISES